MLSFYSVVYPKKQYFGMNDKLTVTIADSLSRK